MKKDLLRRTVFLFTMLCLFSGVTTKAATVPILHGIPWGNCDSPAFSGGTISGSPTGGNWYTYMNWSPSANGAVIGTGEDRHIELTQGWYPQSAIAYYVDDSFTPTDEIWKISADIKVDVVTSNAWAEFSLRSGYDCFSDTAFSLKFSNTTITWIAGDANGTFTSSSGLTTTYKKVTFEYNPVSGEALAWFDGELIYDVDIDTELQVKTVAVFNQNTVYAPRTVYIDNINATDGGSILSGIPWGNCDDPRFSDGNVTGTVLDADEGTIGTWYNYASWNPSAYVIMDGADADRCIKLYQSWYPQCAAAYYVNTDSTPLGQSWKISASLKVDPNYNVTNIAKVLFSLYDGNPATASCIFDMSICGTTVNWKAGCKTGVFTSASGLTTTYKTASFTYDPVTGSVIGLLDSEVVFELMTDTDLQVKGFYVANVNISTTTADEGTVYVDNIKAESAPTVMPVLHGIPCGDFSWPAFTTDKPIETIDNNMVPPLSRGEWSYMHQANASADIVGTGNDRHLELWQEWYPRYAKAYYIDAGTTPVYFNWKISADMKGSWGAHTRTDSIRLYSDSNLDGTPVFKMDFIGTLANWVAGVQSGTATGIGGLTTSYQTVSIEYNPTTGAAVGKVGATTVFSVTAATGLRVKSVQFMNQTPSGIYDCGTLYVDNVKSEGLGYAAKEITIFPSDLLTKRTASTGVEPEVQEAFDFAASAAFQFTGSTVLIVENSDDLIGAELLAKDLLVNNGVTVTTRASYLPEASSFVIIGRKRNSHSPYEDNMTVLPSQLGAIGRESYRMVVSTSGIIIEGDDERGVIYAVQTLRQLVAANASVNRIAIRDWPSMALRGFYNSAITSFADANEQIDLISEYKANMFFLETGWDMSTNWWYCPTYQHAIDAQAFFDRCKKYHVEPVPVVQGLGWAYGVVDTDPNCAEGKSVTGETYPLYYATGTELFHRHVIANSNAPIIVKNTAETVTYTLGTDYTVTPGITQRPFNPNDANYTKWQLKAVSGGAIGNGQLVKVSYNYGYPFSNHIAYCPSEPHTYDIVDDVIANVMSNFKPRVINIGHDEAWQRGTCSRCIGEDINSLTYDDVMYWYDGIRSYDKDVKIMMYDDLVRNGQLGANVSNLPRDIVLLPWMYEADNPAGRAEVQDRISMQTGLGFRIAGLPAGYFESNFRPMWFEEIKDYLFPYGSALGIVYTQWGSSDRFTEIAKSMWNGKSPHNGGDYVSITPKLMWSARSDTTSIDVYLGTNQTNVTNATYVSSEYKGNQTDMTYTPSTLSANTTYYWRIDEIGGSGVIKGTVRSFLTSPPPSGQASSPSPANSATNVIITPTLSWTTANIVWSHDVYLGTNQTNVTNATRASAEYKGYVSQFDNPVTFMLGTLAQNTTYYWRIDEFGPGGEVKGAVWNFKTATVPGLATTPSPATGATGQSIIPTLSWTTGSGSPTHDVYLGLDSTAVTNANRNSMEFIGNQAGVTKAPGTLLASTTYYWRIDEVNAGGTTKGTIWNFTTNDGTPVFVAAGTVTSGTGAIAPALPAGIATNDILLLFLESSNQAITIPTPNGGTWTAVTNSPQYCGTAAGTTGARLTVFWSRYNGTQGAPTTSDSGDHQAGRMIAIRGAAASGNPWDVTAGGVEAVSDTSGSISGATTTVVKTLVVMAIATALPDSTSTANFSAWTNANLTSITERIDSAQTAGNGGAIGIATGIMTTTGAYGNTAVMLATAAYKGMMSIAIKP